MTAPLKKKQAHVWTRGEPVRPNIPFSARWASEVGSAGEHFVCADLLLQGYHAFLVAYYGAPYDVIVDVNGRLLRVVVKSCVEPKPRRGRPDSRGCYTFSIWRSSRDERGKTKPFAYSKKDADIVALVALDTSKVAYLAMRDCPSSMNLHADHGSPRQTKFGPKNGGGNRDFDSFPFASALDSL